MNHCTHICDHFKSILGPKNINNCFYVVFHFNCSFCRLSIYLTILVHFCPSCTQSISVSVWFRYKLICAIFEVLRNNKEHKDTKDECIV